MKIIKFIFISVFTFLIISCGGSSSEVEFVQIFSDSNIHNEEDLKNLGIKKGKKYKVEGLNKANAAIFAFYKKPGEKEAIEYEIRFYDNHNDAVDAGVPMAKERVGPNAKLKKEYATWDEGLKDARQCGGAGGGSDGGAGGGGRLVPGGCGGSIGYVGGSLCGGSGGKSPEPGDPGSSSSISSIMEMSDKSGS